jgi:hypothetical protein
VPSAAEQIAGSLFNNFALKGGRKGMDLSGKLWGQKATEGVTFPDAVNEVQTITITGSPTGGTFTLTYKGATTTAITYNANAAAVQAALEALPTVQSGQVVGAGGALPATPVTITGANLFAGKNIDQITAAGSFTGGSSPAVNVTTTTPGSDGVTYVTPSPMFPLHFTLSMDTSWAALGTTKLTQTFELDYSLGDKWTRTKPINAAQDSDGYVENEKQKHAVQLTMACDSKERAVIAALRAGQTQFVRIEAVGPIIEGAIPYRYRQDFVAFITDVDKGQNLGSVYVRKVKFALGRDLSTGNAMACRVINTRTAL